MGDSIKKGLTIVRTIIDISLTALTANTGVLVACGLVLVEGDAFGASVFPDPLTDDEQPGWLFRTHRRVESESTSVARQFIQEDIKARRTMRGEDAEFLMIWESGAGANVRIAGMIRVLAMKP